MQEAVKGVKRGKISPLWLFAAHARPTRGARPADTKVAEYAMAGSATERMRGIVTMRDCMVTKTVRE